MNTTFQGLIKARGDRIRTNYGFRKPDKINTLEETLQKKTR